MKDFEKEKIYIKYEGGMEIEKFLCTHVSDKLVSFQCNDKSILAKKRRMGLSQYANILVENHEYIIFAGY